MHSKVYTMFWENDFECTSLMHRGRGIALMEEHTRYERGLSKFAEIDGRVEQEVVTPLGDLGRYIIEFAFGDIYTRGVLSQREREIATIAMLTVLGRGEQLQVHFGSALKAGLTVEEIKESIIHTVPYAGFPTAINAMTILNEMAKQRM